MKVITVEKNKLSRRSMANIFYDRDILPSKLVENYYFLVVDLLGTKDIEENTIVLKELKKCISKLDKRSIEYLNLRYGLLDSKFRTLESIHKDVSRERARQILSKAIGILQGQKPRYHIFYRIQLLKSKRDAIDEELNYYQNIVKSNVPVKLTLNDFRFSVRVVNALLRENLTTYEELMGLKPDDIMLIKNLGIKSANEIWLELHGEEIYQYL